MHVALMAGFNLKELKVCNGLWLSMNMIEGGSGGGRKIFRAQQPRIFSIDKEHGCKN